MSRLSYNGAIHAALCLAKDSDEKSLLVQRDVYDLLVFKCIPFLIKEYLSLKDLPDAIRPPTYDDSNKLVKMAKWTSYIRSGRENHLEDIALQEAAIKIVIGSGLWSLIHLLAMMVELNASDNTIRRAFNFVARSTVSWIMCPMCSVHWAQSIDDVDNATKEYAKEMPVRPIERMTSSEVFDWTVKIHNIASGSDKILSADPTRVRTQYLLWNKRLKDFKKL